MVPPGRELTTSLGGGGATEPETGSRYIHIYIIYTYMRSYMDHTTFISISHPYHTHKSMARNKNGASTNSWCLLRQRTCRLGVTWLQRGPTGSPPYKWPTKVAIGLSVSVQNLGRILGMIMVIFTYRLISKSSTGENILQQWNKLLKWSSFYIGQIRVLEELKKTRLGSGLIFSISET